MCNGWGGGEWGEFLRQQDRVPPRTGPAEDSGYLTLTLLTLLLGFPPNLGGGQRTQGTRANDLRLSIPPSSHGTGTQFSPPPAVSSPREAPGMGGVTGGIQTGRAQGEEGWQEQWP